MIVIIFIVTYDIIIILSPATVAIAHDIIIKVNIINVDKIIKIKIIIKTV